jgi:uncharacterized membrane protein YdjX (TVP38/TMEM64 family)
VVVVANRVIWRRVVLLVTLCLILAALASSEAAHEALMAGLRIIEKGMAQHRLAGELSFVAFAAISSMVAFVSAAVAVPAAVFVWGEVLSMLLLWIGWMIGGCATYVAGRLIGLPMVRWLTARHSTSGIEERLRRDMPFGLVLLFQLALPSEIPGYMLGLVRYRFSKYLLALAIAELPYTILTVHLGASFIQRRSAVVVVAGLMLVLMSLGAFQLWRTRMRAGEAIPASD